jgi:hypothetical protein
MCLMKLLRFDCLKSLESCFVVAEGYVHQQRLVEPEPGSLLDRYHWKRSEHLSSEGQRAELKREVRSIFGAGDLKKAASFECWHPVPQSPISNLMMVD